MESLKRINNEFNRIGDKISFVVISALYIHSYVLMSFLCFELDRIRFIPELAIIILTITAFFLLIQNKKIFNQVFWKIIFILAICWRVDSLAVFTVSNNLGSRLDLSLILPNMRFLTMSIVGLIVIPFVILYYYAFRSDVWDK